MISINNSNIYTNREVSCRSIYSPRVMWKRAFLPRITTPRVAIIPPTGVSAQVVEAEQEVIRRVEERCGIAVWLHRYLSCKRLRCLLCDTLGSYTSHFVCFYFCRPFCFYDKMDCVVTLHQLSSAVTTCHELKSEELESGVPKKNRPSTNCTNFLQIILNTKVTA